MSHFESILRNLNFAHSNLNQEPDHNLKSQHVTFILREHFSMMAFTAAMDVLATANLMSHAPTFIIQVAGETKFVMSDLGIPIPVHVTLAELNAASQDIILVCGGFRVRLQGEPLLRAKLREGDQHGAILGALWNGAYFLAEAGLLNGYSCAFHPDGRALISEMFPKVQLSQLAHVVEGRRMTCAGANSALDMMLALLNKGGDDVLRRSVEQTLACDRLLSGAPALAFDIDPKLPRGLRSAMELMHSNIEEPLSIDYVAKNAGVSRRHLERLFRHYLEATPPRYYLELRLTYTRQLIQHTSKSFIEVAVASGFISYPHFYRRFREMFSVTPKQFQDHSRGWLSSK